MQWRIQGLFVFVRINEKNFLYNSNLTRENGTKANIVNLSWVNYFRLEFFIFHCYSFKIFRRSWLAQIARFYSTQRCIAQAASFAGKYHIDLPRFRARSPGCLITSKQKMAFTKFEDEIAELLTKTERKKWKNTQNILLDACYLLLYLHPETMPRSRLWPDWATFSSICIILHT